MIISSVIVGNCVFFLNGLITFNRLIIRVFMVNLYYLLFATSYYADNYNDNNNECYKSSTANSHSEINHAIFSNNKMFPPAILSS